MVLVDSQGLPLEVRLESASLSEVKLSTLAEVGVTRTKGGPGQKPARTIADRGYDSVPLRWRFKKRGLDLIAPYQNDRKQRYEDRRKLRWYSRGWVVAQTDGWLGQCRRLLVPHEHLLPTYRVMLHRLLLDCAPAVFVKHAISE